MKPRTIARSLIALVVSAASACTPQNPTAPTSDVPVLVDAVAPVDDASRGWSRVPAPDPAQGVFGVGGGFRFVRRPLDLAGLQPVVQCVYPCTRILPSVDPIRANRYVHVGPYFFIANVRLDTRTGETLEFWPPSELLHARSYFHWTSVGVSGQLFVEYSHYTTTEGVEHHSIARIDPEELHARVFWNREFAEPPRDPPLNGRYFGIQRMVPLGRWLVFEPDEGNLARFPNVINLETGESFDYGIPNDRDVFALSDHELGIGASGARIVDLDRYQRDGQRAIRRIIESENYADGAVTAISDRYIFYFSTLPENPAFIRNYVTGEEFRVPGPNPHLGSGLLVHGEWASWREVTTATINPEDRSYRMDTWLMHIPTRTKWKMLEAVDSSTELLEDTMFYTTVWGLDPRDQRRRSNGIYAFRLPTATQIAERVARERTSGL